jgi:hypothetical protein
MNARLRKLQHVDSAKLKTLREREKAYKKALWERGQSKDKVAEQQRLIQAWKSGSRADPKRKPTTSRKPRPPTARKSGAGARGRKPPAADDAPTGKTAHDGVTYSVYNFKGDTAGLPKSSRARFFLDGENSFAAGVALQKGLWKITHMTKKTSYGEWEWEHVEQNDPLIGRLESVVNQLAAEQSQ